MHTAKGAEARGLKNPEEKEFTIEQLVYVRDMFVFSCYQYLLVKKANTYLKEIADVCKIKSN
ncbi:MAG: hypothetical protein I8H66_06220 [Sphingobacteriia bacterium]|nr:hypothetical protein [Sphingobacteriia bacterium]